MNFANVKSITIPEGVVKKITAAGVVLWNALPSGYVLFIPSGETTTLVCSNGEEFICKEEAA